MDTLKVYLTSWPALIVSGVVIIVLVIICKFPEEIKKKIKELSNLGGNKGANWKKGGGGKLPDKGLAKIKNEYQMAQGIILGLSSKNDKLLKIAQSLNQELEDTKIMLFFERIFGAMLNWQYFILKVGCEANNRKITLQDVLIKARQAYPDFDQYVTDESLIATLENLQALNFVRAIRPYTKETPLEFTKLTVAFLVYVNNGNLSI